VSAVSNAMALSQWDGVVLDFENLDATVRDRYPSLVAHLADALRRRRVLVTVPAFTDANSDDAAPYDLAGLSRNGVGIVWMAYDQHDPTSEAGPVGGLPWVRQSLAAALRSVPPAQLLMGVASYGYAWPAKGQSGEAADLTVPEAAALAAQPRAHVAFDPVQAEWGGTLPDGRTLWYDDARSLAARAQVAAAAHVGVALWRIGSEAPGALDSIGFVPAKHAPQKPDRPVRDVSGAGLVALTFDDGPDPTWTPRILAVLRREHVPATFFVIGQQAERYPRLLRQELDEGHVIGDHTYSHPNLAKLPDWRSRLEIAGAAWAVEGATGRRPLLFRSPYGNGDAAPNNRKKGADQLAADLGFHPVGWTDDTDDWQQHGPDTIVHTALDQLSERTIILLHDGGGPRDQTVAALPRIIEALKARGYLFVNADALDGATSEAYAVRRGIWASVRGLAVVAAFRLQLALRRLQEEVERALAQAEHEARERARDLEATFEALADPIFIIDKETGPRRINRAARQLLGIPDDLVIGHLYNRGVHLFELFDVQGKLLSQEEWPQAAIFKGKVFQGDEGAGTGKRKADRVGISRIQRLQAVSGWRQGRGCRGVARRRAEGAAHRFPGCGRDPAAQGAQGHEGYRRVRASDPGADQQGSDGRQAGRDRPRRTAGRSAARRRCGSRPDGRDRAYRHLGGLPGVGRPTLKWPTPGASSSPSRAAKAPASRLRLGCWRQRSTRRESRYGQPANPADRPAGRRSGVCCSKARVNAGIRSARPCCSSPRGMTISLA